VPFCGNFAGPSRLTGASRSPIIGMERCYGKLGITRMARDAKKVVAFISAFSPRRCGIATFSSDLIGNQSLCPRGGTRTPFGQQPVTRVLEDASTALEEAPAQDWIGEA